MGKHYCAKCGRELIFTSEEVKDGYNVNTGKPVFDVHYDWTCPKYYNFFDSGHSHFWSYNNPDFKEAIPSGEAQF